MRGGRFLVAGLALTSGCAANHELQVRAIPDPAAKLRYSGSLLDVGRAQLSLGNAGTALETFRKLLREQPANPDAFAGIAACYQAMGRYDLEQANYEFALAYAPHDQRLLTALASSLQRQGQTAQAANIYAEITRAASARSAAAVQPDLTSVDVPRMSSVTVDWPRAAPVAAPAPAAPISVKAAVLPAIVNAGPAPAVVKAIAPRHVDAPTPPTIIAAVAAPAPVSAPANPVLVKAAATPVVLAAMPAVAAKPIALDARELPVIVTAAAPPLPVKPVETPLPLAAAAVPAIMTSAPVEVRRTLAVPRSASVVPARAPAMAETQPAAVALPQRPAQLQPAENKPKPQIVAQEAMEPARQPYLERLSTGEVALVTTSQPLWHRHAAPRVAVASVQWLPLNRANGRPAIQLLNAARSQGLAAHTREALADRGWRKLSIGDAREIRERSLVLYSPEHKALAWRLAAQLRCKAAKVEGRERVVVLLGRDAAQRRLVPSRT
jgi:hypothetical protein